MTALVPSSSSVVMPPDTPPRAIDAGEAEAALTPSALGPLAKV